MQVERTFLLLGCLGPFWKTCRQQAAFAHLIVVQPVQDLVPTVRVSCAWAQPSQTTKTLHMQLHGERGDPGFPKGIPCYALPRLGECCCLLFAHVFVSLP